jgi:uncharacterized membrane protein
VLAPASGWVQRIDDGTVLDGLPFGSKVEILVRPGDFVTESRPLARLTLGSPDLVAAAMTIGVDPTLDQDLTFGISQLADIAERAMAQGNTDSTTAREVVLHLGVVLRELLNRDLPPTERTDRHGRCLTRSSEQTFDGYVAVAFDRMRVIAAASPELAICVFTTIGMLLDDVEEHGLHERTLPLRRQARLLLEAVRDRIDIDADFERVQAEACRIGVGARA